MSFAERLKMLRINKKLSQSEFGNYFGLTKQSISNYENGGSTPYPATLEKMAEFFNVSTDYLLGRTDDPNSMQSGDHSSSLKKLFQKLKEVMQDQSGAGPETTPFILIETLMAFVGIYSQTKGIPLVPAAFQALQCPKLNMTDTEKTELVNEIDKIIKSDSDDPDEAITEEFKKLSPANKMLVKNLIDALKSNN
jgi:transcriptional regulator with XRE-family HTH domain